MMKKSKSALFWGTVLFLSILSVLPAAPALAQKDGGMLRYPISAEPRSTDPHNWYNDKNSNTVSQHIYQTLIGADKDLKFFPELATSWKMAPDFKSCTFTLRKGVKFHDGTPFDARAVEANFNRIATDKPSCWQNVEKWYKSTEVLDDYTIKINLERVYTPFLTEMCYAYTRIISPAALKKYGDKVGQNPSGTGPWKFSEWIPGDRIILTRNPDYWGGAPRLDGITFKITPEATARLMGFESNTFDIIDEPSLVDIGRLVDSKKYVFQTADSGELFALMFNCVASPLDQKMVRQAIAYAINRPAIMKSLLSDRVLPADAFGPAYLSDTLIKKGAYDYNPAKAKEILKTQGWMPGADGILGKDGKRLEFKIMTPSGRYPMDRQIAEAVQANLKAVGIDAKVDVVEAAAFLKWLRASKEELAKSGIGMALRRRPSGVSLDSAFTQHFHSQYGPPAGNNSGFYSNKQLDEYLMKAPSIANDAERKEMYRRAQEILFDELPLVPFYYYLAAMFNWPYVKEIGIFKTVMGPTPYVSNRTWMDK